MVLFTERVKSLCNFCREFNSRQPAPSDDNPQEFLSPVEICFAGGNGEHPFGVLPDAF